MRDAWLRSLGVADAVPAPKPGAGPEHGVACDEAGCVVALVIARTGPEHCAQGELIGPRALRRSEGIAIRRAGDGLTVQTVAQWRGRWPWSRQLTEKLN